MSSKYESSYDRWSEDYDHEFLDLNKYIAPRRVFNAVAGMLDIVDQPIKILDVGVGTGILAQQFRQASGTAHIAGIDISKGMLQKCREKNVADVLEQCNFQENGIPFERNRFDLVVSSGVFELIYERPAFVISEMARVIKPGGMLALTSPINYLDRDSNGRLDPYFVGKCHRQKAMEHMFKNASLDVARTADFIGYEKGGYEVPYRLHIACKPR